MSRPISLRFISHFCRDRKPCGRDRDCSLVLSCLLNFGCNIEILVATSSPWLISSHVATLLLVLSESLSRPSKSVTIEFCHYLT